MSFVYASGLVSIHSGGGDPSEDITVHEIPITETPAWIAARMAEGDAIDPKLYPGLHFLQRHPDGRPRQG